MKNTSCPLCSNPVRCLNRYNKLLCAHCTLKAIDTLKVPVAYYNKSISGGIEAVHAISENETLTDHDLTCFIDGHECRGIELRFGGTAIQLVY